VPAFDLIVTGGQLASSSGLSPADVAVSDGKVAALLAPGTPVEARERIDATGRIVMPGVVDAHVHFREPGIVHKEGFATGGRAAAAGGVTTVMVMPTDNPLTLTVEDFTAKRAMAEGQSHVDIALQAQIADNLDALEGLAAAGAVSFEIFLGDVPPAMLVGDSGRLIEALRRIAALGRVAGITPADDGVIAAATAAVRTAGDASRLGFFRTRPPVSEALGVARACLAAEAARARIHIQQLSCGAAAQVLREARQRQAGLTAEVTPHNLLLGEEEIERQGPFAKVLPPLRPAADLEAMRAALADGTADLVATDHAPHTPEEKEPGKADIWKAPGGFPGVQTLLPLMLEEVAAGRLGWGDLVRLICETPARIFGLYPRKGALLPGADADLVIVDPSASRTIRNEDQLSKAGMTPFAGRRIRGWPVATLLRGSLIMRDGTLIGAPAGRFVAPA